jgi:hypothetical protein
MSRVSPAAGSGPIETRSGSRPDFWNYTVMSDAGDKAEGEPQSGSFFGNILEPGSSLDPTFLLVVDGAFASLFAVLVALAVLTRGNHHLVFLIFIELALWASVKWYVISRSDSRPRNAETSTPSGSSMNGTWHKPTIHRLATLSQSKIERHRPRILLAR